MRQLPLLINSDGIGTLLGVPQNTVKGWRSKALKADTDTGADGTRHLPKEDLNPGDRPLWYTHTIVDWAIERKLVGEDHGWNVPDPVPVWTMADIAHFFGVAEDTVKLRWRWFYTRAIRANETPPPEALCAPDIEVGKVPLWFPQSIFDWGKRPGLSRVDENNQPKKRRGSHWESEQVPVVIPQDPNAHWVDSGGKWTRTRIAEEFGVKVDTVKMWQSPWSAGQNFPAPDAGVLADGSPLWWPRTIRAWADDTERIDEQGNLCAHGGGRPSTKVQPVRDVAVRDGDVLSPFGIIHRADPLAGAIAGGGRGTQRTMCSVIVLLDDDGRPIDGWAHEGLGSARCEKCDHVFERRSNQRVAAFAA